MPRKDYTALFLLALLLRVGVAWVQHSPGFMDAEYYFIGGQALAQGEGFNEQILWNYLDDPDGLPHPSHGYWMPLASMLAALGMWIARSPGFEAAQWVFVLIGSLFPPLTAALGYAFTRSRLSAWISGGIAVLAGFYLPFFTTTETFGLYAVLGAAFFLLLPASRHGDAERAEKHRAAASFLVPLALGLIAGLMHLARAEGLLWLGFAMLGALLAPPSQRASSPRSRGLKGKAGGALSRILLVLAGYALVMLPWFWRNMSVFGAPLAPGGSRALWLTDYNELFIYPASLLTFERWWASGLSAILDARLWALGQNLQRALAEQGMIFLAPFILLGLWARRRDFRVQMAALIWLVNFALMTLVFPCQGARGGFFHASAALLPVFWAVAPLGLERVLAWVVQRRPSWQLQRARKMFFGALLAFVVLFTAFAAGAKLLPQGETPARWEQNRRTYQALEAALTAFDPAPADVVLTINPPGYFAYTQRPAIAIPDGTPATVLEVADRYGARYLLLEESHPEGLNALYAAPENPPSGLAYLTTAAGTHVFQVTR